MTYPKCHGTDASGIFGYFDAPGTATPTHDPGLGALCPICLLVLRGAPLVTISLMAAGDNRSYFFRSHKKCWHLSTPGEKSRIEGALIDTRPCVAQRRREP